MVLLIASTGHAAETCPSVGRVEGPPVYVLLHGYSDSHRPGFRRPTKTDDDLVNMSRFFRALGPEQMHVHGEPTAWLDDRFGGTRRPATWRAVLDSVAEIRRAIERRPAAAPRPQVYIYFAGHGVPGDRDRLDLFSTPETNADGPGFDGEIDSKLIADAIIRPLSAHADLHLIADACYSYHLLQTRSTYGREKLEPRPPSALAYLHDFTSAYPTAGALLAARELTHESVDYGGMFSHLVRSLAIGAADVDLDGVITYGEMARAFPQIISSRARTPLPEVIAPGLDPDRPFIDWRASPAARVCLPAEIAGKRILIDYKALFATLNLPGEVTPVWLPPGRIFGLTTWGNEGRYFRAVDGPADFGVRSPRLPPAAAPDGSAPTGQMAVETTTHSPPPSEPGPPAPTAPDADPKDVWEPLPALFAQPITDIEAAPPPPVPLRVPMTIGAALLVGASVSPPTDNSGRSYAPHVDLAGRVGFGRHRLLVQGGYAWWTFAGGFDPFLLKPGKVSGHRLGGRLGYGVLTTSGATEVSLDLLGGLYRLWNTETEGPEQLHMREVALRAVTNLPFDNWSRGGLRFDFELGVAYAGDWMGPTMRVNVGLDFEAMLD